MIRMKSGVYGARDGMKRASDGPFSLSSEEEARLVRRDVAEYVDNPQSITNEDGPTIPAYDIGMTERQLRGIADYFKVDVSKAKKKQEIIDLLDAHFFADAGGDDTDPDAPADTENTSDPDAPALGAEDPTA